jgi:hypothetical protein
MHIGFVEDHVLAIAPGMHLTVDEDAAIVGIGRDQTEVIAQRAGKRVAVGIQFAAWWKQREHRRLDTGNRLQQCHGLRTQCLGRGQRLAVPFQVETFPALLEKAVETGVVMLFGGTDVALVEQMGSLVANGFPVGLQQIELRKTATVENRSRRHCRERVHLLAAAGICGSLRAGGQSRPVAGLQCFGREIGQS